MTRLLRAALCIAMLLAAAPARAWLANGTPIALAPTEYGSYSAQSDGSGGVYVVWTDPRDGHDQVYAMHLNSNGDPVSGWPFNGLVMRPSANPQVQPRIGVGGDHSLTIFEHDALIRAEALRYVTVSATAAVLDSGAVPMQFIAANEEHSALVDAAGHRWVGLSQHGVGSSAQMWSPGMLNTFSFGNADVRDTSRPFLDTDGAGGAFVVWQAQLDAELDIAYGHLLANGTLAPGSHTSGDTLVSAPGAQEAPQIVADGAGGFYAAWIDRRNGNPDVYATHRLFSGALAPGWHANGDAVCVATGVQSDVRVARDAGGGLLLAWDDARAGNDDIYVCALGVDGARRNGFPANGLAVATGAATQMMPALTALGDGTGVVAWVVQSGGATGFDIRAARFSQHGNLTPGVNGAAVSSAVGDQFLPTVVPGSGSDVIVVWDDERSGEDDLYGQRVALAAPLAVPSAESGARLAISRVWPQPVRGAQLHFACTLPDAREASVTLLDVAGRAILAPRTIAGAGAHELDLDASGAAPGLYFVRLTQGRERRSARVVITR